MRWQQRSSTAAGLLPIALILFTCGSREVAEKVIRFEGHDQFEQEEESALRKVARRVPDLLGEPADEADWPSAVFVRSPEESFASVCSANLIGPRVVLTAAHCLRPGDKIAVDGVSGTCEEPPGVSDCPTT